MNDKSRYYHNPNHDYFTEHFEELVDNHGGEWVVIAGGELIEVGPKEKLGRMMEKAKERYPDDIMLVSPIPAVEDLECIL